MSANEGALFCKQLLLGPMDNFVYLVGPARGDVCAVVDPAWDVPAIVRAAKEAGRKITHALVTHSHDDHINGLDELFEQGPIQVVAQRREIDFSDVLSKLERAPSSKVLVVNEGDVVDVGGLGVRCLHTPGHTPGAQCFLCGGSLFSGDTLFVDACGRCDFAGSDPNAMFDSLARLKALPPETILCSGHDYGDTPTDTIGHQLQSNPYLRLADRNGFISYRMRPRN
jgi:glyoxylase-like metal-dependent hydrolase (beta-lactamase superfamily II)